MKTVRELSAEEQRVLRRVLQSSELQNLIGAEEWDLTEAEEETLWTIIKEWR